MKTGMTSKRVNRRRELEYLVKLYKFCEDNYNYLQFDNDFRKVIEAQETKIAYLFNKIVDNKEEIDIDELPLKVTEINGYSIEDIDYERMNKEEN